MKEEHKEKLGAPIGTWQKIVQVMNSMGTDEKTGRLGDFTITLTQLTWQMYSSHGTVVLAASKLDVFIMEEVRWRERRS